MDQKTIVETVFKAVVAVLPTELGALLGQELKCSAPTCQVVSKEKFFAGNSRPKSSLSHLKVTGEHEGEAFLILNTKTSIIFGGTLIMLPQGQIDENVSKEKLDGEVADAFGEVANILAGVLTQVFLDKHPKSLRFIRTEVEELVEATVDVASDKPFPAGNYFHVSSDLSMGSAPLGRIEFLTPLHLLEMGEVDPAAANPPSTEESAPATVEGIASAPPPEPQEKPQPAPPPTPARPPFADAKKLADVVLKATIAQVAEEVSALLGQPLACTDLKLEMVTKEDFFENHCLEKSILTHMEVSGSSSGQSYLFHQIKDAILMGGTLIMLPDDEIHTQMGKGAFAGEVADAYGEVANIISGGLTQTFLDRYPKPLRFVKKNSELIAPTKIIATDDSPFPAGRYYLASCALALQGKSIDRMHLLFPAEIFGLEAQEAEAKTPPAGQDAAQIQAKAAAKQTSQETPPGASVPRSAPSQSRQAPPPPEDATPVILVIADNSADADAISNNLANDNYEIKIIGYKDDVRAVFGAHPVLGVFLLMSEVGEKGFSVAIKLQSCGYPLPPVIAGGPEWTRTAVLKAIKYGARDILVTPASDAEIRTKASEHIKIPA